MANTLCCLQCSLPFLCSNCALALFVAWIWCIAHFFFVVCAVVDVAGSCCWVDCIDFGLASKSTYPMSKLVTVIRLPNSTERIRKSKILSLLGLALTSSPLQFGLWVLTLVDSCISIFYLALGILFICIMVLLVHFRRKRKRQRRIKSRNIEKISLFNLAQFQRMKKKMPYDLLSFECISSIALCAPVRNISLSFSRLFYIILYVHFRLQCVHICTITCNEDILK